MKNDNLNAILSELAENAAPTSRIDLWPTLKDRLATSEFRLKQGDASMKTDSSQTPLLRRAVLALLAIAIAFAILLATPQGRAWAQSILRHIGNFVISNEPSEAERYVATLQSGTPTPTADPNWVCNECGASGLLTVAQASAKTGFPVYGPKYIPAGYQVSSRDVFVSDGSTTADVSYRIELDPPLHDGLQMSGIIDISQTRFSDSKLSWKSDVGEVPLVDVFVRSQPGLWLEQVPVTAFQNEDGKWDYARWNQLMWAEADYNFMIQTNMPADILPLDELLKIAESLTP
jgi:hypothetical protein